MTVDYNDGKIHGWNGGECPVHPETVVMAWHRSLPFSLDWCAKDREQAIKWWGDDTFPIAFQDFSKGCEDYK